VLIILYVFIKWVVNVVALFVVTRTITGVTIDNWKAVITAALALFVLNASIKPLIFILTLPLNVASLGIFTLVINGLIFFLTAKMIKGFHVIDFWSAFWAAIIFSLVSLLFRFALGPKFSFRYIFTKFYRRIRPRSKNAGSEKDGEREIGQTDTEKDGETKR